MQVSPTEVITVIGFGVLLFAAIVRLGVVIARGFSKTGPGGAQLTDKELEDIMTAVEGVVEVATSGRAGGALVKASLEEVREAAQEYNQAITTGVKVPAAKKAFRKRLRSVTRGL